MSAEDDTFDIDIYGENEQQQQEPDFEQEIEDIADGGEYDYDGTYEGAASQHDDATVGESQVLPTTETKDEQAPGQQPSSLAESTPTAPQQGTKRKALDEDFQDHAQDYPDVNANPASDPQRIDPAATSAIKFADLNWWTTEEDLRAFCVHAGVEAELRELTFGEHKINGKSRGEAYLEFSSPQAATAVKREVEKANELASSAGPGKRTVLGVFFAPVGNPFKTGANSGGAKMISGQANASSGRGGAYNQGYGHQRGNFGGRGGFNQNRGGFNNHNNNGNFNRMNQQQQGGWMGGGMNGNMGGFGNNGYGGNPMMGMMNNFGNMGRGGMMNNNMMGRGGFGMGNMGNMGPMMNRGNMMGGNMNMMGRGGWNGSGGFQGGMQQGFPNGGFPGGGGMQQGNKRAKME